jgi:hypothetical protein
VRSYFNIQVAGDPRATLELLGSLDGVDKFARTQDGTLASFAFFANPLTSGALVRVSGRTVLDAAIFVLL